MAGKKKPKVARPAIRKSSAPSPQGLLPAADSSRERLCWRFTYVDHDSRWGFDQVDPATLCEILRKLAHCESMTVGQLRNSQPLFKDYDPGGLVRAARDRLQEMGRDDMTKIQRLEFTGKQRLYGFLHDNVFHVVWWDPKHDIWPSKLKNT